MPRLGFSLSQNFASSLPAVEMGPYGRAIRRVKTVVASDHGGERPIHLHPLLLKFVGCLAMLAALAMAVALWRLFHFTR